MQITELHYQHHKNAPYFFKGLSFTLEKGKIHALHGKNGMGKTVLMKTLSGQQPREAILRGKIDGYEKVILVNQRFDMMIADQFSFQDNLKFACMESYPSAFKRCREPNSFPNILERFRIDYSIPAHKLSGGQRQIMALLMVLQKKVDVLLLDEPTALLDEQNARMVFEFLQDLVKQGVTILVICHDRELVEEYAKDKQLYLTIGLDGVRNLL